MNFFEHQDRARRQTRILVVLFVLAVIAIIAAVDMVVLAAMGHQAVTSPEPLSWTGFLRENLGLIGVASAITAAIIFGASTLRSLQLRSGGGEVARQLGGSRVEPDTNDPLRRRLRNVVEEIAIAAGVPVPEIYVLDHEQGINAFAAGYSTADAAVAVTRGTLEHLDRDELQGVIAHEFSHILNGDMRLNIRLIGFLFGILVIAILGRRLLFSARFARDSRNAAPAVLIGLAVVIIGYIGLFFGRWIKAAVSRQREFLADASAVQFTRHPEGIGTALKKIGALYSGSFLKTDSEEVGHMLFARGMGYQMFATHPPLEKRIQAIDPSFDPAEFKQIAEKLERHAQARQAEAEEAERRRQAAETARAAPGGLPLDAGTLAERIGQPGLEQAFAAAILAAAIPAPLERAAHSDEWAREVICYLLLAGDDDIREQQLLMVARSLGSESERQVRELRHACAGLPRNQRLPLVEIAFPALRRQPEAELIDFMRLLDELVHADDRVEVFEYALSRLVSRQIRDALRPAQARAAGSKKLSSMVDEATQLMAILARHGHADDPDQAGGAFAAGMAELTDTPPEAMSEVDNWPETLDRVLGRLDMLKPASRHKLVLGLVRCISHDGQIVEQELDLLRVICGLLHVPLPLAQSGSPAGN